MERKLLQALLSEVDFTSSLVSTGVYTITFSSAHPAGANYVVQVTGINCVASIRNTLLPSSTGFGVVCWSAGGTWPTGQNNAYYFTVSY